MLIPQEAGVPLQALVDIAEDAQFLGREVDVEVARCAQELADVVRGEAVAATRIRHPLAAIEDRRHLLKDVPLPRSPQVESRAAGSLAVEQLQRVAADQSRYAFPRPLCDVP